MRIMTVRQPWAWAIIHGGKNIENRVRNIAGSYRGPVAIHAGLAFDRAGLASPVLHEAWVANGGDEGRGGWGTRHSGMILGVVDLVDVHRAQSSDLKPPTCWQPADFIGWVPFDGADPYPEFEPRMCSAWGQQDGYHLVLANPRPLAEPIPYKGALGLRALDDDTTAQITESLKGSV